MPFSNPIVGGQSKLIRSAIQSPNYVPGTSGWTINRDGTAEFASATLHGSLPVSDLTDGTLDANADLGTGSVRTGTSGSRVVIDGAGIRAYDGTNAQTFDVDAATGAVTLTGSATVPVDALTSGTLDADATLGTGAVQTGSSGSRVVLDSAGLRAYDTSDNETINIDATTGDGTFTGNISVVDLVTQATLGALDSEGNFSGPNAYLSEDVFVEGLGLVGTAASSPNIPRIPGATDGGGGIVDSLPYGLVSYGPFVVANGRTIAANTIWGIVSQSFQAELGRAYEVRLSNLWVTAATNASYHEPVLNANLPASDGDQTTTTPTVGGGTFMGFELHGNGNANSQHKCFATFGPYRCGPGLEIPHSGLVQLVCYMLNPSGAPTLTYHQTSSAFPYVGFLNVYDVGPAIGATSGYLDVGSGGSSAPTQNYSKSYACSDSGSYDGSNAYESFRGKEMVQGYYSSSNGRESAMAIFPSMTSDLSGATITGMSITLHNHHTYYNSGATVEIGLHGNTSLPGTFNIGTWPVITKAITKGSTVTLAIPSAYWAGFQSGTYRGFNLHAPSNSLDYYSKYDGYSWSYPPKINVSYTK